MNPNWCSLAFLNSVILGFVEMKKWAQDVETVDVSMYRECSERAQQ